MLFPLFEMFSRPPHSAPTCLSGTCLVPTSHLPPLWCFFLPPHLCACNMCASAATWEQGACISGASSCLHMTEKQLKRSLLSPCTGSHDGRTGGAWRQVMSAADSNRHPLCQSGLTSLLSGILSEMGRKRGGESGFPSFCFTLPGNFKGLGCVSKLWAAVWGDWALWLARPGSGTNPVYPGAFQGRGWECLVGVDWQLHLVRNNERVTPSKKGADNRWLWDRMTC